MYCYKIFNKQTGLFYHKVKGYAEHWNEIGTIYNKLSYARSAIKSNFLFTADYYQDLVIIKYKLVEYSQIKQLENVK